MDGRLTRRELLTWLAGTAFAATCPLTRALALASQAKPAQPGFIQPQHFIYFDVGPPERGFSQAGRLVVHDLERETLKSHRLEVFYPHSLVMRPGHPWEGAITSFQEKDVAVYDLKSMRARSKLRSAQFHFYGHATYSADGRWLFVSGMDMQRGGVFVLDAETLKIEELIHAPNFLPHDIRLGPSGSYLITADRGWHSWATDEKRGGSRVVYIDTATGKISRSIAMADPDRYAIHLEHAGADAWFVLCQEALRTTNPPRPPSASLLGLLDPQGKLEFLRDSEHARYSLGQNTFGAAYASRFGVLAVTDQYRGGVLSFWQIPERRLISVSGILRPTAIRLNPEGDEFIVSSTNHGIYVIAADTLRVKRWLPAEGVVHVAGHGHLAYA